MICEATRFARSSGRSATTTPAIRPIISRRRNSRSASAAPGCALAPWISASSALRYAGSSHTLSSRRTIRSPSPSNPSASTGPITSAGRNGSCIAAANSPSLDLKK